MAKTIKTPCGEIRGTPTPWENVTAYKGIRYATADRWEYPQPVTHWEGVYQATEYGACCYQPRSFIDEEAVSQNAFYYNEFRRGQHYSYSEDCLFLNIWAQDDAKNLPVIVYIHGGSFTGGCAHEKSFDNPVWAAKGVIAVTLNYRLGPLGFLCLPELKEQFGKTGNYGLYDQLAALQWLHRNIEAFGGNPNNITIMGQSAGAISVQMHCLSPLSKNLIAKAVMCSGGGVNKDFPALVPAETHYPFWQRVMKKADCNSIEELKALEPKKLFAAWNQEASGVQGFSCCPCIDHDLLVESPLDTLAANRQQAIPYMIGSTSEDIIPPILYQMAKEWGLTNHSQHNPDCYGWHFSRQLPGDDNGAWHSSDLWYWFGTLNQCWRPFTLRDRELSQQMVEYLIHFATTGNPNHGDLPIWVPISSANDKMMVFGDNSTQMDSVDVQQLIHTMNTKPPVGE